jgi:hypothetical protein
MSRNEFKKLMQQLMDLRTRGDEWIDKVPGEVVSVFFENPYVDAALRSNTVLMEALFDKTMLQEVEWFLYEWRPDAREELRTITYPNGSTFTINTLNDFVDYLHAEGYLN